MDAGLLAQYVVVGLAVIASLGYIAATRFPHQVRALRVWTAVRLLRAGRPAWVRTVARRIAPAAVSADGTCGGCTGCSTPG